MARSNINVQPSIKVPAGYRFTVRVNRDILLASPCRCGESPPAACAAWTSTKITTRADHPLAAAQGTRPVFRGNAGASLRKK
jgi:hypothetical protein